MDEAAAAPDANKPAPVIIKKYANRRLYNTGSSSYITLEHLATMTREGRDFQVLDAKSGEDITRSVLTQIVMDGENGGQTMLPIPFLRQLIAMYGNSMQSMVPHYLEASMNAFAKSQAQFRDTVTGAMGSAMGGGGVFPATALKPFEAIAKQNLAMFQAATDLLSGRPPKPVDAPADELGALKEQMNALQAKLDKLGEK
ncbi:polyhydroxyalkanoate synthesis repressor PhaR [Sphingosinicellaceae bacterium]|nr:polyhydroxyalkanoate synthesis repressor PhaR [Sphingosinicellaceae bacterium]